MANQVLQNTFTEGMALDYLESLQPKGTYRYAKNAILFNRNNLGFGISNEESNQKVADTNSPVVGKVFVERLNTTILFLEGDIIGAFDHSTEQYTEIAKASEFGCEWGFNQCEWIDAEYKTMQPCDELYVYFSSNCVYYRINLSELLSPTRKSALISAITKGNSNPKNCGYNCDYFKLMNCVCSPKITHSTTENGGHSLEAGVYKFAVQLEDKEGNTTNWSEVSQPIYIGSESNQLGERTSASIHLHLTGLDCRYDIANIAVINGFGAAEIVARRQYSTDGISFVYYGQKGTTISIDEIITKGKRYLRGRSLEQKDSRLYLYNIRQEKNPDMQRRVFQSVALQFITIQTSPKIAERYNFPSLQRGENYLFGVVYKYCDGTHSPVFLLNPSNGVGSSGPSFTNVSPSSSVSGKEEKYRRVRGGGGAGCGGGCGGGVNTSGCSGGGCGPGGTQTNGPIKPGPDGEPSTDPPTNEASGFQTRLPNWENSARCNDCHPPVCCQVDDEGNVQPIILDTDNNCEGCTEDEQAIANDGPDHEAIQVAQMDNLTYQGTDTTVRPSSSDLIDASTTHINLAVENAEFIIREKGTYNISSSAGSTVSPESTTPNIDSTNTVNESVPRDLLKETPTIHNSSEVRWGDYFHTSKEERSFEKGIKIVERWNPLVVTTTELYPDTRDCNGQPVYGDKANQPVELFRTPDAAENPIIQPTSKGVPNRFSPASDPYYAADVRLLGIEVTGIPLPNNDEDWFPKPLCPNEPYRIVMVERDLINSTVQANAFATSTMTGPSGGQTHIFPRHGLCSRDKVDFHIQNGDSHFGTSGSPTVYNLHGLDTNINKIGLSGEFLRENARVAAEGYRYGLYAEGKKPDDRLSGNRIDQRGARQFLNANLVESTGQEIGITGISYVGANVRSTSITGIAHPVSNAYRESSVFVGLTQSLSGPQEDNSFKTDTLDHEVPIVNAHGWYVSVIRDIPDQYGSVPGMKFIDTGVRANGRTTATRGICGDVFIGPYSFVRKGYVSDKVGNTFPTPERPRTVCDSADDLLLQNLDINHYPTRLPKTGDESDARNWAGGYMNRRAIAVANSNSEPENDYYYPKVQKTLVVTWLESRINPWKRATGIGNQVDAGLAYYPRLQGMHLDSFVAREHPWEESFINRFYYRVEQPSPAQLLRKALLRNLVEIILPAAGLIGGASNQLPTDITAWFYILPALVAYWRLAKDVLTREDYLNKMVGISDCKTDSEGGEPDNMIVNFEDNYHDYNMQFSAKTTENFYKTMPLNYNTCQCDSCLDYQTTNEIYYSQKQLAGSSIDAYKNFRGLDYNEVGVDGGKIRRLFKLNGNFYAHTTEGIVQIKYDSVTTQTSMGMAILGGTEFIIEPHFIFEGIEEGYAGTQDPNAGIITPHGYFFIDREARKIYRFDGKAPEEISSNLMFNFFKENLDFCEIGNCHDEKNESSTFYSMGWDNRYNRLLITKRSKNSDESFTISYYPLLGKGGKWGSFHDYIPQVYLWDRDKLFTITKGQIWKQNIKNKFQQFYGKTYPFEVEFIATADGDWFNYNSTELHTLAWRKDIKGIAETFTSVAAWNYYQGTGLLPVKLFSDEDGVIYRQGDLIEETVHLKVRKVRRRYLFNELFDHTLPNCQAKPLTLFNKCAYYPSINQSVFDCDPPQKQGYDGKLLADDHLTYKLSYNGGDLETNLNLLQVKTSVTRQMQ